MTTSESGKSFIKSKEALRLTAYKPTLTDHWTIGTGHTGRDVYPGLTITETHADELLTQDLAAAEHCINQYVRIPLLQTQFDPLVSLVFNCGVGAFIRSHLLMDLNFGDMMSAKVDWLDWDHQGGIVLPGLAERRKEEWEKFSAVESESKVPPVLSSPPSPVTNVVEIFNKSNPPTTD